MSPKKIIKTDSKKNFSNEFQNCEIFQFQIILPYISSFKKTQIEQYKDT